MNIIQLYCRRISTGLLVAVSLIGPGAATAYGQSRALGLEEAIALSLNHSHALKIANSQIDEAIATVKEAKNHRLPDIDVSGQYLRVNKPNVQLKIGGTQEANGEAEQGAATPNVSQAMFGMATATLPLFSGGRISSGIESAKYLEKAAELDAEDNRQQVIQNTVAAYVNLYKAQAAVKLVEENLRSSNRRVADFINMEANGLVARNDLLKVQLQESNLELALLTAKNEEQISNYNFDLMLGIAENTPLLLDSTVVEGRAAAGTLMDWEQTALNHRADEKALENRILAARAAVTGAKSSYYPTLALRAGYVAVNVPHALTVTNAMNAGAGLSYNLASLYKAGATVRRARAREEALNWNREQLQDDIKIEIHQAYQDLDQSLKKITVCQKAMVQADENFRITKNKYDNSLATTTDLLDADVARLQTHIDYEYAKADALVSYYQLHERAGITVAPSASQQNEQPINRYHNK